MDTNFLFSTILLILFLIVVIEWDEAFILFILGFMGLAVAINMDTILSISNTSYQGFGQLIRLVWAFVGVFAFVKSFWSAPMFERIRTRWYKKNGQ